jgi:hypothetical protein
MPDCCRSWGEVVFSPSTPNSVFAAPDWQVSPSHPAGSMGPCGSLTAELSDRLLSRLES